MLEGIERAPGVRVNRVAPQLVSLSAGRNPHGKRCTINYPIRNLFILVNNYLLPAYNHLLPTYEYVELFADCTQVAIE